MSPRIGSLFSGTGALDLAVQAVFGGEVIWHCQYEPPDKNGREDKNQYAAKILARHWPTVPNLWDITKVCWQCVLEELGEVDILTGGFPCTDVSSAGQRAGLTPGTRSGLWNHMAYAISILNPRLVIIENVEGLLSAPADRGLGLDAEALEEEARAGRILRALGAVLGDLASLGFHAEWERVGADEVGAPHRRRRVFIYAWPAHADPADLGHERSRDARRWGHGSADRGLGVAHPSSSRREGTGPQRGRLGGCGDATSADADGRGRDRGPEGGQPERERGLDPVGRGVRREAAEPACPTCGCGESFHDAGGFCAGCHGCTDPELGRPGEAPADADDFGRRANVLDLRPGQPDLDWGDYGPAIRRWEAVLGRPAPWPTDALGRLSPVFTEWLMGLPDGWVTCTPGLTRSAMLRALGNGVVWQQAAAAIRLLHQRACEDTSEAAA